MKKTLFLLLVILLVIALLVVLIYIRNQSDRNVLPPDFDQTSFNYLPTSATNNVIQHTNYSLSYSVKDRQAEWVAYRLNVEELNRSVERSDEFREDPKLRQGAVSGNDYRRSGYDRGHLAPAADMGFSEVAMKESFYMSNISPQKKDFNRGIWKKMEEQVRNWVRKHGNLYIVTGGVLTQPMGTIGEKNKITVPKYFYKVLLDLEEPGVKAIALLFTNERSDAPLSNFVVTIDSVEALTGIDFFPALPDEAENKLESQISLKGWNFSDN